MQQFNYSPSVYHQALLKNTHQEMSFQADTPEIWKKKLTSKLKTLMGYKTAPKTDLNPRSLWSKETKYGNIEKIVYTSEPYCDVPTYVCLPKNAKPPYKFFICLQGHSTGMHNSIAVDINDENKIIDVPGDRDFGISAMKNGYAALCIEQRAFGERAEKTQAQISTQGCHDASMQALLLGTTLLAQRVRDVDRAIDYLYTRNDVSRENIGIMGNSGGGTVSLFSAAILKRISYAMPSCYFCTFADSIMSIYHCADNYIPGLLQYAEMKDIMGLFAPKPVVIVAGEKDPIFPIQSTKKAFQDLKKIYKSFGAENNCKLIIGTEGHRFYAKEAWEQMTKLIKKQST